MAEEICFFFPFQYDKLQTLAENACGNICNKCFGFIILSKKNPEVYFITLKQLKNRN